MLNGAFAMGATDCITHRTEELPHPRINIPKAMLAQYVVGFLTTFLYLIAIFYSVNDITALLSPANPWPFPLAELYRQSTNSHAGSLGLLIVLFLPKFSTGCNVTCGRMLWTLGRDGATPFPAWIAKVDSKWGNPFNATFCGIITSILGLICLGSSTAFAAFVGPYIVMSSCSYLAFMLPNILSRRKHIIRGPFSMPDPVFYTVAGTACAYMIVWIPIYCFSSTDPFTYQTMNYSSTMVGGCTILLGFWYLWVRSRGYLGPGKLVEEVERRIAEGGNEGLGWKG